MSNFDNSHDLVGRQVLFIDAAISHCPEPDDMKIADLNKTGLHLFHDVGYTVVAISGGGNAMFVHLNFAQTMEVAFILQMSAKALLRQDPLL